MPMSSDDERCTTSGRPSRLIHSIISATLRLKAPSSPVIIDIVISSIPAAEVVPDIDAARPSIIFDEAKRLIHCGMLPLRNIACSM